MAVSEVAGGYLGEIPDAIGFSLSVPNGGSTVIEVKVTRSDFLADRKKPHRQPGQGMGVFRYYMAPQGLIGLGELPPGWGLIEVNGRGHCKVLAGALVGCRELGYDALSTQVDIWRNPADAGREQWLLVKLLARLGDTEELNQRMRDAYREKDRMSKLFGEQEVALKTARRELQRAQWKLDRIERGQAGTPDPFDLALPIPKAIPKSARAW